MKKRYWDRLNVDIVADLRKKADLAADSGNYLEALLIQSLFMEASARLCLQELTGGKKKLENYWEGDHRVHDIINFLELSGLRTSTITKLRKYNHARNQLVHHLMEFKDIEVITRAAKQQYMSGEKLGPELLREAGIES